MKKVEEPQAKPGLPQGNLMKIGLFLASLIVGVALALASIFAIG
jgi:hypothetical protein